MAELSVRLARFAGGSAIDGVELKGGLCRWRTDTGWAELILID